MAEHKIKRVSDFPQLTVTDIQPNDDYVILTGGLSKELSAPLGTRYWLINGTDIYLGDTLEYNRDTGKFKVHILEDDNAILPGHAFTCTNSYWNWNFIEYLADTTNAWIKIDFKASDAQEFMQNGVRGWCQVGGKLREGQVATGKIIKDGWDHENCDLCEERIDKNNPVGYRDPKDWFWLCAECYDKYGRTGDLSFIPD
ncbi:MAG: hypothetical protein H6756_04245 [Candidatus Omnitrophica bacterium]|nr:hypothetical protein [Candidatus Omnitrophota bacterium]